MLCSALQQRQTDILKPLGLAPEDVKLPLSPRSEDAYARINEEFDMLYSQLQDPGEHAAQNHAEVTCDQSIISFFSVIDTSKHLRIASLTVCTAFNCFVLSTIMCCAFLLVYQRLRMTHCMQQSLRGSLHAQLDRQSQLHLCGNEYMSRCNADGC